MARVAINTGAAANDGTGDTLRAAGGVINDNFLEVYTYLGAGSTTTLSAPVWNTTSVGINTLRNVGMGTTNPRFALEVGAVGTSGTTLFVNGDARITGILSIGTSSITLNGSTNIINVGTGVTINGSTGIISATSIVLSGTTLTGAAVTSIVAGTGINVSGSTGQVTITATGSGESSQFVTTAAGIHTLSNIGIGTTNPTSALTVVGSGTSTSQLFVTGVSTFQDNLGVGATTNPPAYTLDVAGYARIRDGLILTGGSTYPVELFADLIIGGYNLDILGGGNLNVDPGNLNVGGNVVVYSPGTLNVGTGGTVITTTSAGLVGIGTTNPTSALTVIGSGTSTSQLFVTGVSTFVGLITAGRITAGLTSSIIPFYYDTYASLPSYSTYHGAVAHAHDTGKLYYAHTRWVELVNTEADGTVGTGTERYNIGITSVTTLNVSGVVTATSFVGDGSGLTGVVGSGSGLIIKDSGTTVGTAGTIDFGDNLTVSPISAGVVTVTGSASGGSSQFVTTAAGIHTLSNVGIGTTNPTSKLTVGAVGAATTNLVVNGWANISGMNIVQDTDTNSIYIGYEAGQSLLTQANDNGNIALGYRSLYGSTSPDYCIAIGYEALRNPTSNTDNTIAIGHQAGYNGGGGSNVFIGYEAGQNATTGHSNVAIGYHAARSSSPSFGVYIGYDAGKNADGIGNVFVGHNAGDGVTSGDYNTFIGEAAGNDMTTGSDNVIIGGYQGNEKGLDIRTSSNNIVLSDGDGNIRFYANSSGNVGIGTTNPTSALTVVGSGTSTSQLFVTGVSTFSYIQNTGITSTKDLIVYGTGNDAGSASTISLRSRNNYIDFNAQLATAQSFAIRLLNYPILQGTYLYPTGGSAALNNWDGTEAIVVNDTGILMGPAFAGPGTGRPVIIGTGTSTGTALQQLQVTGGAYVSGNVGLGTANPLGPLQVGVGSSAVIVTSTGSVGIGTTNPTSALTVVGSGTSTSQLFVTGVSTFAGITTVTGPTLFAKQLNVSGITTATSFRTNTTVGDGTDVGFAIKYYITANNNSSAYRFAGPGVLNSTDDPTIYLHRGFTYIFENSTGTNHPFAIRTSSGGSAYTSAFLSGSQSGTQIFTVPFDAPNTLVYQCTIHSNMVGTLNIVT